MANNLMISIGYDELNEVTRMSGKKASLITVQNTPVTIMKFDKADYICLTDMAKA